MKEILTFDARDEKTCLYLDACPFIGTLCLNGTEFSVTVESCGSYSRYFSVTFMKYPGAIKTTKTVTWDTDTVIEYIQIVLPIK